MEFNPQSYTHHYGSSRYRTILDLPNELIDDIVFYSAYRSDCHLTRRRHLELPRSLSPLLLTCKRLYSVIMGSTGGGAVWRRIFRSSFSSSAVERRFGMAKKRKTRSIIGNADYHFQLKLYVSALKDIQRRSTYLKNMDYSEAFDDPILSSVDDESQSVEELMWVLWVMCLEDDGKNRLQLDLVGAYGWVEAYTRQRLYDAAESNQGYPLDNAVNSCALHVFWYLTTKDRIFAESPQSREELVQLVLPYVTSPFRYTSAFLPPNHFTVPAKEPPSATALLSQTSSLDSAFDLAKDDNALNPHGPYPIYFSPAERTWNHIFYNRRVPMTVPLITEAAKLVHAARRELHKITVSDGAGFSRTRWEYNQLHGYNGRKTVMPTLEDFDEFNDCMLGGEADDMDGSSGLLAQGTTRSGKRRERGGGTALTRVPRVVYRSSSSSSAYSPSRLSDIVSVDESPCSSQDWDKDWWRLRSCLTWLDDDDSMSCADEDEDIEYEDEAETDSGYQNSIVDFHEPTPSNTTSTPGEMAGLWVGKLFLPSETHFSSLLTRNTLPSNFNEDSLGPLVSVPVYVRLREYRLVRAGGDDSRPPEGPMSNGWLPWGTTFRQSEEGIVVSVPATATAQPQEFVYRATTLNPNPAELIDSEDTILLGQTDPRHGDAWHHHRFFGRVRRWDGCVCLVRVPLDSDDDTTSPLTTTTVNATTTTITTKPTIIFYGSLVGGARNFVGNWRVASPASSSSPSDAEDWEWSPQWEGGVSLGKREEW